MWIKPLRSMVGSYGSIRKGVIAQVPPHIAQQLVKRGVAVPVQASESVKGKATQTEAAKTAPENPQEHRSGGPTGGAKPSSSSREAQAPKTRRSRKSEDAPE